MTFLHLWSSDYSGWIKVPLGKEVGLGPGHIVLDGDPVHPTAAPPHFLAHVYCGQTVISAIAEMGDRLNSCLKPTSICQELRAKE